MRNEVKVGNIIGYDLPMYKGVPFIVHSIYDTGVVIRKIKYEKNDRMINCHNLAMLPIPITIHRLRKSKRSIMNLIPDLVDVSKCSLGLILFLTIKKSFSTLILINKGCERETLLCLMAFSTKI